MLSSQSTDLRKRELLTVVEAQAKSILRLERADGLVQGALRHRDVRRTRRVGLHGSSKGRPPTVAPLIVERLETCHRAAPIDVPLDEHRSEPGRQAAAPVIVGKERSPLAVALGSVFVEAAGLALIWFASTSAVAAAGAALTGFGYALVYPGLGVEAVRRASPQNRGR